MAHSLPWRSTLFNTGSVTPGSRVLYGIAYTTLGFYQVGKVRPDDHRAPLHPAITNTSKRSNTASAERGPRSSRHEGSEWIALRIKPHSDRDQLDSRLFLEHGVDAK
jgi:hypothetical protein